ncbi:MAG: serine/threonine protein kinase [Planctomycetes bacterium]|nr:serine/threonine protein kinase [Planctomycetota bacterium]
MSLAFGPYVVEAELGRGGAGVVYRARDAAGGVVAVKVLLPRPGADAHALRRLAREARVLERLRHPGIVPVRAMGEAPRGGLWIAMDLVDGQTLQRRLDTQGPLAPAAAAALVAEVARAVAHAHAQGVLHRDVKPDNVLLDRAGRPFLTDFGLAKDLDGTLHGASLSVSGQFLGTPGYWAPEQARGERGSVGPATDVHGLGATLHAALTGGPPFRAASLVEALQNAEREPPPPSRANPAVPAALDAVCARAMRLDPAARHASADDLARDLEAFLAAARRPRRRRRPRWPLALGAAAGVVALAAALWGLRPATPPAPEAASPDVDPPPAPPDASPPPLDPAAEVAAAATLSLEGRHGEALARVLALVRAGAALDLAESREALQVARRATPGAGDSFLTPRGPAEHLEAAAEVLDALAERSTSDVVRVMAAQTLGRALHGRADPARVERALRTRSDMVLAELRLAEGRLDEAARLLEAQGTSPPADLLRAVLQVERALAAGRPVDAPAEALEAAHHGIQAARLTDTWTRSVLDHLRARRAVALGLPPAHEDRELTGPEVARLLRLRDELGPRERLATFFDVADALPAAARAQHTVRQLVASSHAVRAKELADAGDAAAAEEQRARARALLTPPRDGLDRLLEGDLLRQEGRWSEALSVFLSLARAPANLLLVRGRALETLGEAAPELQACFLAASGGSPAAGRWLELLRLLAPEGEEPGPQRTQALELRARLAHLAGAVAAADEALARALAEEPDAPGLARCEVELHLREGRLVDAREALEHLRARAGAGPLLDALLRLLEAEEALAAGDGVAARARTGALLAALGGDDRGWPGHVRARARLLLERLGD